LVLTVESLQSASPLYLCIFSAVVVAVSLVVYVSHNVVVSIRYLSATFVCVCHLIGMQLDLTFATFLVSVRYTHTHIHWLKINFHSIVCVCVGVFYLRNLRQINIYYSFWLQMSFGPVSVSQPCKLLATLFI